MAKINADIFLNYSIENLNDLLSKQATTRRVTINEGIQQIVSLLASFAEDIEAAGFLRKDDGFDNGLAEYFVHSS